jgi:serine/threonine protein kinase
MSKSPAETIYSAWATKPNTRAIRPEAVQNGEFQSFLERSGFKPIIDGVIKLYQQNGLTQLGLRKTVEQMWKLLDKMKDRHGEVPALELLRAMESNPSLRAALDTFAENYTPSIYTEDADQLKIDAGRSTWQGLVTLYFPRADRTIKIIKKLGQGGMGGAVYLGADVKKPKEKFAVKHFPGDYKARTYARLKPQDRALRNKILYDNPEAGYFSRRKNLVREQLYKLPNGDLLTPNAVCMRINEFLTRFSEGVLTTTCLDFIQRGCDQYLLLELGEGEVDYTALSMADVVSIFEDLSNIQEFGQRYMKIHLTQDVGLIHLDIHGGNMMRFKGRLRFIDFGLAMLYDPNTVEKYKRVKLKTYEQNRNNPEYYLQSETGDNARGFIDPEGGSPKKYLDDWKKSYGVSPTVWVCRACNKQYPNVDKYTECFACGSKKVEKAPLRKVDLESLAKLQKKDPFDLLVRPHKDAKFKRISPVQYGCIVLTAVLIKEIWAAVQYKEKMDFGLGQVAKFIQNVNVYSQARRLFPRFRMAAPESALLIGLLLAWFDEMMLRLLKGDLFTARDAVRYFDRGGSRPKRGRSAEI